MVEKSANIRHDHVLYPVFLDRKKFVSSLTLNKSKMADSGNAARKRDLDQNHFILHGCRCTELKSNNNSFHIHCPCDICSGKAVPPTTAWRHRETTKRAKLTTDDHEEGDDEGLCNSISVDSAVEFSASYSEQQMTGLGNLTNADPLLLGDDDGNMMLSDDYDQGGGEEAAADEETCSENGFIANENEEENFQKFIHDAVLKLVEIKGENGFSIKAFEELLSWGKDLHCHNNTEARQKWPSSWEDVKSYLETIGYRDANLYWICLDASHPCNYSLMESKEERCQHCGEFPKIPYYYLNIIDKVIRWCSSPVMCKKMTTHWEQREHWLPPESRVGWGFPVKKEIWDGKRFAELSYFWDPSQEWILPTYCPIEGCNKVISAEELLHAPEMDGMRDVTCPGCFNSFTAAINVTHGDPRNIAYIGKVVNIVFNHICYS